MKNRRRPRKREYLWISIAAMLGGYLVYLNWQRKAAAASAASASVLLSPETAAPIQEPDDIMAFPYYVESGPLWVK